MRAAPGMRRHATPHRAAEFSFDLRSAFSWLTAAAAAEHSE